MAIEGEFPKIGGDVVYASEDNNNELYSTLTKNLIHTTRLTANIGSVDIGYTFAQSDVCSDAGGYNNTINTGQTTARYTGSAYIVGGSLYDNFNDSSLNTSLWESGTSTTGANASGVVFESSTQLQLSARSTDGAGENATAFVTSIKGYQDYFKWDVDSYILSAQCGMWVTIGSYTLIGSGTPIAGVYGAGTWELINISGITHNLYKDGNLISAHSSGLSGAIQFIVRANDTAGVGHAGSMYIDNVNLGHYNGSNLVLTNGAGFTNNIKSIFSDINGNVSGPGVSITYDASSNGGSAYQQTNIGVGSWTGLLNAGSMGVIKYKLNNNGSFTPFLFGYGYMVSE